MEYEYDSWNRIQNMTYPDGEVVSYRYNKGGMLQSIIGEKNGISYPYIGNILYDEFELKKKKEYGNSTHTEYEYDDLQRLVHLESRTLQGEWMQDIVYDYDGVGNITKITNSAAKINGIGGPYHVDYTYDGLYRMTHAEGYHDTDETAYVVDMSYFANGRIQRKAVRQPDIWYKNSIMWYSSQYSYPTQKNTVTGIAPSQTSFPNYLGLTGLHLEPIGNPPTYRQLPDNYSFQWDGAGNMMRQTDNIHNSVRQLSWDAENRLQGVKDNAYLSLYLYDANGERTYKLTGSGYTQIINGVPTRLYALTSATLYASPYLVATVKGYTKHYYAENERIASRIGDGGLSRIDTPIVDLTLCTWKLSANSTYFDTVAQNRLSAPNYITTHLLDTLYHWKIPHGNTEPDCYWYHPDHLGSSSWITFTDGSAVQHLHYLPWGEDFVDQRTTNWAALHTFSAKEKDSETGLSYFGARYYSSDLSIWLSVDPMSDKYPHQSNYVYCSNNPIKLIDPNGEDEWELSRDGYLTKRENGRTDVDIVYATDKNGKEISRYYKAGAINQNPDDYPGELILDDNDPSKKIDFTTHIMSFTNANVATDFFEFAAENTDVEWALNIGEAETIVGTSHQDDFNQVRSPQNVKYQIHSHWSYRHILSSRGPDGTPCPTCDIPMMINNPNTYKVYEAFKRRYVSMDDQKNYRYEISKNIQKSINLFQTTHRLWFK